MRELRLGIGRAVWIWLSGFLLASQVFADPLSQPMIAPSRDALAAQGTALSHIQQFEHDGIRVEFSLRAVAHNQDRQDAQVGQTVLAQFALRDTRTGQPLSSGRPKAWMNARLSETVATERACTDKIRSLASGQLGSRPDVDLNGYALVTLNHDKTITFINPQIAFTPTKLESIVPLPGVGTDWVLARDGRILYVTLSDEAAIAVIDTTTRQLVRTISTGTASRPTRLALQPDGRAVWVGLDGAAQVLALDTETHATAKTIPVGQGPHALVFSDDSRYLAVTNSVSNNVSVIDLRTFMVVDTLPVGKTPVALAYGPAAKRFYVGSLNENTISVIDPGTHRIVATIPTQPGVVALRFEPTGRFVVAVNQLESTASVIDTATNAVIGSTRVVKDPDQVTFTQRYAYIRGIESEKFSLIDLTDLRQGRPAPVEIQAGQHAPSTAPDQLGIADMIVPAPEGNTVMVANAPDQTLYFYQEGMMAPMGTFSNYKRMPRGLLILDRSLRETAPGVYSVPVTLTKGGRFDVPILLDQPRLSHCFQVTIANGPNDQFPTHGPALTIEPLFQNHTFAAGVPSSLRFKMTHPLTRQAVTNLTDVQVLFIEPPGTWQQRKVATHLGDGVYAVLERFPHPGQYTVMVQVPSQRLRYNDSPPATLSVANGSTTKETPPSPTQREAR